MDRSLEGVSDAGLSLAPRQEATHAQVVKMEKTSFGGRASHFYGNCNPGRTSVVLIHDAKYIDRRRIS
jgi:hypothetical protein